MDVVNEEGRGFNYVFFYFFIFGFGWDIFRFRVVFFFLDGIILWNLIDFCGISLEDCELDI